MTDSTQTHDTMKPARYMFDEIFSLDAGGAKKSPPAFSTEALEAAVATARSEGHAAGVAEGRRAAEDAIEGRIAASLQQLVAAMTQFTQHVEAHRGETETAAVDLAMTAVGRLVPALISREPTAEMAELLRGCLSGIRDVPHVAVRISEDLVEPMRARFDAVASETGFTGRVVVLGEPDIAPGDGRIDWADGGVVRNVGEIRQAIEAAVDKFIAVKSGTRPAPGDESNE